MNANVFLPANNLFSVQFTFFYVPSDCVKFVEIGKNYNFKLNQ